VTRVHVALALRRFSLISLVLLNVIVSISVFINFSLSTCILDDADERGRVGIVATTSGAPGQSGAFPELLKDVTVY